MLELCMEKLAMKTMSRHRAKANEQRHCKHIVLSNKRGGDYVTHRQYKM